ncbi:MAG: L,D-transpeptidase family protein [Fimbriimonadaceae bacterium]|nr:L,D-transpeptidase family protein [Fimbriimonadaceae bacterium]
MAVGLFVALATLGCGPVRPEPTSSMPPGTGEVFLRAFKAEAELELWENAKPGEPFVLLRTFPIARLSGKPGPKRREGDGQVPEGFYTIDRFNPNSRFHLSLGLDYPNASDRIRGDKNEPGSDIFIHGSNVSIGCLAMTDPWIEEIYARCAAARDRGQRAIRVHLFPARFGTEAMRALERRYAKDAALLAFWKELEPAYREFERTRRVPPIKVGAEGQYLVGSLAR